MRDATDKPNIILINCDDLGYGDLGCFGSTVNRTPALDALASNGVRLTSFYMASPVCSPSRGAMMTGCYPRRIGFGTFNGGAWVLFPGFSEGLNPSEVTVAKILKGRGYATKIIGKWHCGDQREFLPTRHGFDSYFGIPYSNDMGRQKGKDGGVPLPLLDDEEVIQAQPDQANVIERYTAHATRFIRDHRDRPFFLYLAHMQVHLPLYAPQRFVDESGNGRYGACVEAVDWSTAVLVRELQRLGLDRNTLIVFTSDNGSRARDEGGSNAPLNGTKGTTWEGGQRVPCIACWPGQIPAGRTCDEVTTSMDFLPTFAALAGGSPPDDRIIDGKDIGPLLRGESGARSPHEAFFYYFRDDLEAVRSGKWKLFVRRKGEEVAELYDLDADIGETTNVHGDHPDVVAELSAHMDRIRADIGDEAVGARGAHCRPCGKVDDPEPLLTYDETYPYIMAEYDLPQRG
jgi:arylsulfatase A-like enzyme